MADEEKKGRGTPMLMTEEQFERLLAKVGNPSGPDGAPPGTPDEEVQAVLKRLREGDAKRQAEKHTVDEIPVVSAETGARFIAIVASSKSFPQGRVLTLQNYEYPDGVELHRNEGGLVPDGMTIKSPKGELTKQFKQWRWTEYYQADLRRYVGKDAEWLRRMADIGAAQSASGPR